MKIKSKYILFTFSIISLHLIFLTFFSFAVLQPQIINSSKEILHKVDKNLEDVIKKEKYKDTTHFFHELALNAPINHVTFSVTNIDSKVVFMTGVSSPEPARIKAERICKIGNDYFLVQSEDSIGLRKFIVAFFINELLFVEIALIFITVLISGAVMLRDYVNPLILLAKQMNDYEKNAAVPQTPRKRCDELGFLQQQFISLIQTVQKEKQKQLQLVASISHDIKTPLTSIMGYVERLVSKDLSEEKQKHYLQIIYSKAQHMNEIVNEFDEYTSYNLEKSLNLLPYNAVRIREIILQEFSAELSDIHVPFEVQNECENQLLHLDLLKFKRVIGNLISNSLKHMGDNPSIIIRMKPENNGVLIIFEDNGTGVSPEDLPYIFDPLFTTDKSRKVAGLGLSICQNIIKSHNGTLEAYNKPDRGFGISIWLPSTH